MEDAPPIEGANSSSSGLDRSVPPSDNPVLPSGNIAGPQGDIETEDEWGGTGYKTPPEDVDMGELDLMLLYNNEDNVQGGGHVSEVYSPPRIAPMAASHGLKSGYSLDLTTGGADGIAYDFDKRSCRAKARRLMREKRPALLVCSPMCTALSNLFKMNRERMGEIKYQQCVAKARRHLKFAIELCEEQMASGNYFLFERPAYASSWLDPEMVKLIKKPSVRTVISSMCRFGMQSTFQDGSPGLVAKPTRFATNSEYLSQELDVQCEKDHEHAHLMGGRAAAAQVYPPALCKAVVVGIKKQIKEDSRWMEAQEDTKDVMLLEIDVSDDEDCPSLCDDDSDDLEVNLNSEVSSCGSDDWEAEDDVHGGSLDPEGVKAARKVEMKYVKDRQIYDYSTVDECRRKTGSAPIGTKWVDTNKGDKLRPLYRSRLVAMEFRRKRVATIFAATPPLEAVRMLMSILASRQPTRLGKGEMPYKLGLFDVSRAHFYADAERKVFIRLPPEDPRAGEPGVCGILRKSMYGCRDAAALWESHYSKVLIKGGFEKGRASPCCFFHRNRGIWVVVHGDDFITVSDEPGMKYMEKILSDSYSIKASVIGPGKGSKPSGAS